MGHPAAKILRKHARNSVVVVLTFVPRAFLRIFHRDAPTLSHLPDVFEQPALRGAWAHGQEALFMSEIGR
jgi:hypothetical protein